MMRHPGFVVFLSLLSGPLMSAIAADTSEEQPEVDYSRDVRPIFSDNCYVCHGPDPGRRMTEWRLDIKESALGELDSGEMAIVPGKREESELYLRIRSENKFERMPQAKSGKRLSEEQIELIARWIDQGAPWEEHWAFKKPERPTPVGLMDDAFIRNPIDCFVLARLQQEAIAPSALADKATLIRRVTLDLTGLPPAPAEIDAFLADESSDAYEKLVDRLLDSPRRAEHMTRYWLDAARYGDTHGLHLDNLRSMWPYRDWVIKAFEQNMPFDQFTIEQLAGDLLPEATPSQRVASGFNRAHVTTSEGGSISEEYVVRYAVDRTETMGKVWMGLTVGCAVCHDHKFDPISQKEFYQLYAYFNNTAENPMDGNKPYQKSVDLRLPSDEQTSQLEKYDGELSAIRERIRTELTKIEYQDPASEAVDSDKEGAAQQMPQSPPPEESLIVWERDQRKAKAAKLPEPVRKAILTEPDQRDDAQQRQIRDYFMEHVHAKTRDRFAELRKQIATVEKQRAEVEKQVPWALVTRERSEQRPAHLLKRGEYDKPGEQVQRNVPAVLPPLPKDAPNNRLGLARWLVDPSHPLTARVAVNRLWQQHFGTGLVKTSENFGAQGEWPSHPKLLDWLATEFIRSGWDVRHVQRLIVTSGTYRQSSRISAEAVARDPRNRLLGRGPRFRMDAEMVRDNALAISGLLVEKLGGPSVKPYQPDGLWNAVAYTTSNTARFTQDHGEALYRRSLYTFHKRTSPPPTMLLLDAPSRETCVVNRARTNTPLAALALMNDVQMFEAARKLAERMMLQGDRTPQERVAYGFRLATARHADEAEIGLLVRQYETHLAEFRQDQESATQIVAVGESPRDPSLDVGELAAWTMVANLILNLDETLTKE